MEGVTVIADTLPLGPRRTAVAKAEVEVTVARETLNLAIDNRNWAEAVTALAAVRKAQDKVAAVLSTWILDIPGAEEWANGPP